MIGSPFCNRIPLHLLALLGVLLAPHGALAQNWTQAAPPVSPPARAFGSMVYDAARQQMVLFGGATDVQNHIYIGDTWVFDGTT